MSRTSASAEAAARRNLGSFFSPGLRWNASRAFVAIDSRMLACLARTLSESNLMPSIVSRSYDSLICLTWK